MWNKESDYLPLIYIRKNKYSFPMCGDIIIAE